MALPAQEAVPSLDPAPSEATQAPQAAPLAATFEAPAGESDLACSARLVVVLLVGEVGG